MDSSFAMYSEKKSTSFFFNNFLNLSKIFALFNLSKKYSNYFFSYCKNFKKAHSSLPAIQTRHTWPLKIEDKTKQRRKQQKVRVDGGKGLFGARFGRVFRKKFCLFRSEASRSCLRKENERKRGAARSFCKLPAIG